VIVGKHRGQSEVVIDPISPKSWSLSQTKQASPVKLEADVILVNFFAQLITHRNPGDRDIPWSGQVLVQF
jgi:hypothetical protein